MLSTSLSIRFLVIGLSVLETLTRFRVWENPELLVSYGTHKKLIKYLKDLHHVMSSTIPLPLCGLAGDPRQPHPYCYRLRVWLRQPSTSPSPWLYSYNPPNRQPDSLGCATVHLGITGVAGSNPTY